MYIITGLGRCGTSILTKYLQSVGFELGRNVHWHKEVNAGYELSTFYSLVDDLYQRYLKKGVSINLDQHCLGAYWDDYTYREAFNLVDKDERQGKVDVVKDPRITWHPDLIEAIWECRKDIKLIICHRKPENIKKSRETLPKQYGDPKPRTKLEHYKIDFCDFHSRVLELGIPHIILYFPNFILNTQKLYIDLYSFGIKHDYSEEKLSLFDANIIRR